MAYSEKSTGLLFHEHHLWVCETKTDEGSEVWFEIVEGAQLERNFPENVLQYVKDNYPDHVLHEGLGMFVKGPTTEE